MSAARDEILGRIRRALADVPATERPDDVPVQRAYRHRNELDRAGLVERFAQTVGEYRATVRRVSVADLPTEVEAECAERGLQRIVVPPALPPEWRPGGAEVIDDDN